VSEDENVVQAAQFAKQMYGYGLESMTDAIDELQGGIDYFSAQVDVNLNMELKGRTTGDDPDDFTQTVYGNGNVKHSIKDESHGTHVAGIIAAERGNGLGVDGVANNVQIMAVRAVPNGDEYDKDVALAIRYAADNGAKVMNTSFGKAYSPHSDKVREAIAYAASKDVLIVNAAGNDALDLDKNKSYPNDAVDNGPEVADNFVTVGALAPNNGEDVVASFSNYGKINVDVFAPGAKIYSTTPENEYDTKGGTSMAAPAVAGVAALIRSYFPKLTASQVKSVLMASGLPKNGDVIIGGNPDKKSSFDDLSKSGKMVNAYNAFILASKMSK
jgi:subtilisin family serine protease